MRKLGKLLLGAVAVVVVLALVVVGIRAVNGWRYDDGSDLPDPAALSSYDLDQEGMSIEHVTGESMNGFHLVPDEVTRRGVIVVFGGSEGSPDFERAVALAGEGYEVYSLFFFGQDNQPEMLTRVPLDFFSEVTARIEETAIRPGPLTVIGSSKGAELALTLAENYEEIDNVVLFAPSAYRFQGLSFGQDPGSSWTLDGEDLPYLSFQKASFGALAGTLSALAFNYPITYRPTYESVVERSSEAEREAALIDPTAVDGGLLVFAGEDDQLWQSDVAAEMIKEAHPEAEVHTFPGAGHAFIGGETLGGLRNGGSEEANATARDESAALLLERLETWHT